VSGHACQEELKLLISLVKPKYFIPVHGEYRHLKLHAALAERVGINPKNIVISDIGKVIEVGPNSIRQNATVPSGVVLVDGLGVGDVGNIVLRDRKHLAEDGIIVVVVTLAKKTGEILSGPDVLSRGFVYVRESEDLMEEAKLVARTALEKCADKKVTDWGSLKSSLKSSMSDFMYAKTKRKPMVLPVIMEV
ncbi:MAG: MBL fold metallo-hydrolase RNA specificity domain-containing protein, partial [Clostridia bacterium]